MGGCISPELSSVPVWLRWLLASATIPLPPPSCPLTPPRQSQDFMDQLLADCPHCGAMPDPEDASAASAAAATPSEALLFLPTWMVDQWQTGGRMGDCEWRGEQTGRPCPPCLALPCPALLYPDLVASLTPPHYLSH